MGSIGNRHARILRELGCTVAVVSGRPQPDWEQYATLDEALSFDLPDYVVVANETSRHGHALSLLTDYGFDGHVLCEKPVAPARADILRAPEQTRVGYNLRYHPLADVLRDAVQAHRPLVMTLAVGYWLPLWRPDRDYRTGYAAQKSLGGGVLRDLSHELDLLTWLVGPVQRVTALGGHVSQLETDTDDAWSILAQTRDCGIVSVQLNYLDRVARRTVHMLHDDGSLLADFVAATHQRDADPAVFLTVDRDATYRAMHLDMLTGGARRTATLDESLHVLDSVHAIEQSATDASWQVVPPTGCFS
jgi:predicted dehydrogenase